MNVPSTWNPSYSVGHPVLDEQHMRLLALVGQIAACAEDDSLEGTNQFHVILGELSVYAMTHFHTEEQLLSQCNYALLKEQRAEHQRYKVGLGDFHLSALSGVVDKVGLKQYLSDWWLHHILESDMRYKDALQGISPA